MAQIRSWEKTPSGGVRLSAALTRTGVLTYRNAAGTITREYRAPEEVFHADSMMSLRGAPVTDRHPQALVTPSTWKQVAVGSVGDDIAREDSFLVASVLVNDGPVIEKVIGGECKEVSCGYTCGIDPTPGVAPTGEAYDARQVNIRYNHAALGPSGWGRAGAEVSLRLDAAVEVVPDPLVDLGANRSTADGTSAMEPAMTIKKVLKVRGKEIELRADDDMTAAQGAVDTMEADAAKDAAELTSVKDAMNNLLTAYNDLKGKLDALVAKNAAESAPAAATAATSAATAEPTVAVMDAAIEKRLAVIENARKIVGADFDHKGKSEREIMQAAIAKRIPAVKFDAMSADTVNGMFTALVSAPVAAPATNEALGQANAQAVHADAGNVAKEPGLQEKLIERGRAPLNGAQKGS